jgi:hypothetical protein
LETKTKSLETPIKSMHTAHFILLLFETRNKNKQIFILSAQKNTRPYPQGILKCE